jgi:predicted enzyme related to lactoylglutathione lyase
MEHKYDRAAEDLGNIVALEHVNVTVPEQPVAVTFYVTGLGLTRDPFLMTGTQNMWINVGRCQIHLPRNKPQVLRGHVGLVMPDRNALVRRLTRVRKYLEGTRFDFEEHEAFVDAICPWGNRFRCYEPDQHFGAIRLGIPYAEFDVPTGTAEGIVRFYQKIMGTSAKVVENEGNRHARVNVGIGQHLRFRETAKRLPPYDGHHIQVYVADFSGPYRKLLKHGLIFEESDQHQYRFKDLIDPSTGKVMYTIEHEVRSMKHPIYLRPLVNRNPAQSNVDYAPGYDASNWGMPHED